jgi:hypothetical protein
LGHICCPPLGHPLLHDLLGQLIFAMCSLVVSAAATHTAGCTPCDSCAAHEALRCVLRASHSFLQSS